MMLIEDGPFEWTPEDMLEVILPDADAFLKIKETLTRIGVASSNSKTLYPSCHILHKRGKYYIVHFKELFILDGRVGELSVEDIARRNTIAQLLQQWGLCTLTKDVSELVTTTLNKIKVVPFKEKKEWTIKPKFVMVSDRRRKAEQLF